MSRRVAELPSRNYSDTGGRPARGHDALTNLVSFPEAELLAMTLQHLDARSLLALELVSKGVRASLKGAALESVWDAHLPVQVDQKLGQFTNCIGKENENRTVPSNLDARSKYLRSRQATLRLRDVVDGAKKKYKIPTGRNGSVETTTHTSVAHPALVSWWRDVKEAILQGADAELRDNSEQTLLHWAVTLGDLKMARELLKAGGPTTYLHAHVRARPAGPHRHGARPLDLAIPGSRVHNMLLEYA